MITVPRKYEARIGREVYDGKLTGDLRMRVGWFGIMVAEVSIEKHDGSVVWRRASDQEFTWCMRDVLW